MNYVFSERISSLKPSAIREILKATSDPSVIPFAAGNPDAEAFPIDEVREISQKIFAEKRFNTALRRVTLLFVKRSGKFLKRTRISGRKTMKLS